MYLNAWGCSVRPKHVAYVDESNQFVVADGSTCANCNNVFFSLITATTKWGKTLSQLILKFRNRLYAWTTRELLNGPSKNFILEIITRIYRKINISSKTEQLYRRLHTKAHIHICVRLHHIYQTYAYRVVSTHGVHLLATSVLNGVSKRPSSSVSPVLINGFYIFREGGKQYFSSVCLIATT